MSTETLSPEKLTFDRGDESFEKDKFVEIVKPFFSDLKKHGRTNFLFVATFGDGRKPAVTGYHGSDTINATINSRVLDSTKSGGKWAVFKLND